MTTESITRRIMQKELRLFFASPAAWLFVASFAVTCLFIFFWVEAFFARNIADIRPLFDWMPVLLIFLCATLTMYAWSDERRTGTQEHLLTLPPGTWRIVLGKFFACLAMLVLALSCTLPLPITTALIADLDWGPVLGGYIATILLGSAYLGVGLFMSARTDNAIVSLITTVCLCGLLYLVGSETVTAFFSGATANVLRALGSGSHFDSISRGVLDLRDLLYYLSLCTVFLLLNGYALEQQRWAKAVATPVHRRWRATLVLLIANVVVANIGLARIDSLRLDLTEGKQYSLSPATRELLDNLPEPLLLRGYFSDRTHPLLVPLIPQLEDVMREYGVAGGDRLRVELVDPRQNADAEREAGERYGIAATPFQVADRYESSLVNAYFNILVAYGDDYETLSYTDLIEVRTAPARQAQVLLRNPEYDISRAIKNVVQRYQSGGALFDRLQEPVEFIGYVSGDGQLPEKLQAYKRSIARQMQALAANSAGIFSARFIEPEARDGTVAKRITEQWGFKPMVAGLNKAGTFYFYLTLANSKQVVQLPTGSFDADSFSSTLASGIRRFVPGLTKTVSLVVPQVSEQMSRFKLGGPTFRQLEQAIARDYKAQREDLSDAQVSSKTDILAVIAPHQLDRAGVFAIDQFLMRGGTVIIVTSPHTVQLSDGLLTIKDWDSGLQKWLAHNGVVIGNSLILDQQNAPFPAPTVHQNNGQEIRGVSMVNYPWLVDLRQPGLNADHPITAELPQVTMAWPSPISISAVAEHKVTPLLSSSVHSWLSSSADIRPGSAHVPDDPNNPGTGASAFAGKQLTGVVIQGRFDSYFANQKLPQIEPGPATEGANDEYPPATGVILHSPESARIVLYSSNDFMDDQILNAETAGRGTQYRGPLALFMNTLDWALQDDELVDIRARGHFNRTLPSLPRRARQGIEYFNYAIVLLWLLSLAAGNALLNHLRRRRYARELGL